MIRDGESYRFTDDTLLDPVQRAVKADLERQSNPLRDSVSQRQYNARLEAAWRNPSPIHILPLTGGNDG